MACARSIRVGKSDSDSEVCCEEGSVVLETMKLSLSFCPFHNLDKPSYVASAVAEAFRPVSLRSASFSFFNFILYSEGHVFQIST